MKKLVIGILAHVDAGKTTLSESMLYLSGKIRKLGRVDNKDAYLDTYELEKQRGITIFSKQAMMEWKDTKVTLLDTPGHVDFSAEMERTLQVLDYAILVISGADGIQGHTFTLWKLLRMYGIPTFLFINKMDQSGTDKEKLLQEIKHHLHEGCVDFTDQDSEGFYDSIAMTDERIMEDFLLKGSVSSEDIGTLVAQRKIYPCFFGSALKLQGIEELMEGITKYTNNKEYPTSFGAKIFKISRDEQGNRLTFMKVTGGNLKVKEVLNNHSLSNEVANTNHDEWSEKVNQIRLYSGQKFEVVNEVEAGGICAVTGLSKAKPGERLGIENKSYQPILEPVLSYRILLPDDCDYRTFLPKLRLIEEEQPELRIVWEENLQEIHVQLMGEVQTEILQSIIKERFDVQVTFDTGNIVYKETIANVVEGVGHFEPLGHYAEVHLLLEPGERGSGLVFGTRCSEDDFEKNWQRLVLSHLEEKGHIGVLTGSLITDMKITLVAGRAHKKHTSGGDFREATYRALRQGIKKAKSLLLEPYYEFRLELPEKMVGRAMTDIEKMHGTCEISHSDGEVAVLVGNGPVVTMRNYQREVIAYTKGQGRLFSSVKGYQPCHNEEEVIEDIGYDSERDILHPTGSVFCANGAGFLVNWNEVEQYMHLESVFTEKKEEMNSQRSVSTAERTEERSIGLEEIDAILNQTYYSNVGEKSTWKKRKTASESYYKPAVYHSRDHALKENYLLVDGYNIIFSWEDLNALAQEDLESAKSRLLDTLCNYQGIKKNHVIVVFDAYRVQGHLTEFFDYNNIHVVYTKEAETADQYIEKFVHKHQGEYAVTVATSDGLEQIIIRGKGAALFSARELKEEIEWTSKRNMESYQEKQGVERNFLSDSLSKEQAEKFDEMRKSEE